MQTRTDSLTTWPGWPLARSERSPSAREIEARFRDQTRTHPHRMDLVSREEFEAVKAMAPKHGGAGIVATAPWSAGGATGRVGATAPVQPGEDQRPLNPSGTWTACTK